MATIETLNQNFSEICRLCLKQDGVMASIFQTVDPEEGEFSLAQRISTIARVQIQEEDGLPSLICHICRHQVEKSYNFRQLVELSDRTLRNYLETVEAEETCDEENIITIKQENLDKNTELTEEDNIDLEQFLLQNNLSDSDIDPSAVNVILVQSEDGTQVLNICNINEDIQDTEKLDGTLKNIKNEYPVSPEKFPDPIASDICEKDENNSELDDLEGIRRLLDSEKMYVEVSESQIQNIYSCTECEGMFLTEDQLNDHFSSDHGEDREEIEAYDNDISCQLCFESFKSLSELKNHITEHFSQNKNFDNIKSEEDDDRIEEKDIHDNNFVNVLDDNYQYVLEVSKSDENYSETLNTNNLVDEIRGDCLEDRIISIDSSNCVNKNNRKLIYEEEDYGSIDLESNSNVDKDVEYKSDILYCVKEYFCDRINKSKSTGNYPCDQCDKIFTQKHDHTLHLRRHMGIRPFKCTFCDKAFITNALKKEHERAHTGDKAFVCIVCGKSFVKKSELKYHEGVHTDSPSTCNICNKEFSNVQSFKMHAKRHLLGSRYVCETCGKSYYTNSELARHVQMHSGKREYPCNLCETSFLSRPELNRHLKYHIGEKKFRCKICFKSYFESGHLKIHERVHTGEKPFTCTVCNKAFVTKPKLVRHEKIHSKEISGNCSGITTNDDKCQFVEAVKVETMS